MHLDDVRAAARAHRAAEQQLHWTLIEGYYAGLRVRDLAAAAGVSHERVYRLLRAGVPEEEASAPGHIQGT